MKERVIHMNNYKDILRDNWDFYKYAIGEYNSDNVAYAKMEARMQEELMEKLKNVVRTEHKSVCHDDVDIDNDEELTGKAKVSMIFRVLKVDIIA